MTLAGCDEINDIVDDINVMRERIGENIKRREIDAKNLEQAAEQADQARNAAESASLAKSQFLSSISHEFRTPLQSIVSYAQLMKLEEKQPSDSPNARYLERILKASEQLSRLVNNVLDMSQAEKGILPIHIETVAPVPIIRDAVELVDLSAAERSIKICNRVAGDGLPNVLADPNRLFQILLNLLANSIKYNIDGGTIFVDAEVSADRKLKISITDTGPGIPEEKVDSLFHWFERLGKETGSIRGVGIGLALCQNLVTRMNGRIGFENIREGGCTFWFELPVSEGKTIAPLAEPRQSGPAAEAPSGDHTIFYIEDNPDLIELMEVIIARIPNYVLRTANSAEEGLRLIEGASPDLILMDINLPGMDGIAACRQLKQNPKTAGIPVIAVTGAAMKHDVERAKDIGFFAYLSKPFSIKTALQTIGAALDRPKP